MTRPTASEQLSAWIDGELSDAEAAELEAELARDPSLRAELEELESVVQLLHRDGPVSAPDGFEARVLARTERERIPGLRLAWVRRPLGVPIEVWGLGLAVAAALVVTVLPTLRGGQPEEPPEPAALDVRTFPKTESAPTLPGASSAGPGDNKDHAQLLNRGRNLSAGGGVSGEAAAPAEPEQVEVAAPPPPPDPVLTTYQGTQRWVAASDDPEAKRDLLKLLSEWSGGTVTNSDGQEIQSATRLTGSEDFVIDLDGKDLYAFQRDLETRLARLGFTEIPTASLDDLYAGRVRVVVSLQWKPDEQGTAAP